MNGWILILKTKSNLMFQNNIYMVYWVYSETVHGWDFQTDINDDNNGICISIGSVMNKQDDSIITKFDYFGKFNNQ